MKFVKCGLLRSYFWHSMFYFPLFFCKLLFSSRAPFFHHFPLHDPSYEKQMVQCGAPWQMSVLHGICCVTGCLNWNIRAQCPSSDDQLVIAEAVFKLSFCHHAFTQPLSHLLFLAQHADVRYCPPRQKSTNMPKTNTNTRAHPLMSVTALCDRQLDRRVPAGSHWFSFLSLVEFVLFCQNKMERCK